MDPPDVDALRVGGQYAIEDSAAALGLAVLELELRHLREHLDMTCARKGINRALQHRLCRSRIATHH